MQQTMRRRRLIPMWSKTANMDDRKAYGMTLTRGQKAAATRKRNYGKKATREHIEEMLRELPNVTEEKLMVDLRFYEYVIAYRAMVAREAAGKTGKMRTRCSPSS